MKSEYNDVFVLYVRLPFNGRLTGQLDAKLIMALLEVFAINWWIVLYRIGRFTLRNLSNKFGGKNRFIM